MFIFDFITARWTVADSPGARRGRRLRGDRLWLPLLLQLIDLAAHIAAMLAGTSHRTSEVE